MHRVITLLSALALSSSAIASESITLWGCTQGGERRNVLYLADRGAASYVKVGAQRVDASLSISDEEHRWTFGTNHISLTPDGLAEYFEDGVLKGQFRCRQM